MAATENNGGKGGGQNRKLEGGAKGQTSGHQALRYNLYQGIEQFFDDC